MASVLRPEPEPTLPVWPLDPEWAPELGPARGICYSILFALPLWLALAAAALALRG